MPVRFIGEHIEGVAREPVILALNKVANKPMIKRHPSNQPDSAMNNLILVVMLAAAGYFGYQYFYLPSQESAGDGRPADSGAGIFVPDVPEECRDKAREYENAVYSADSPRTSFAQRNYARRAFMTCLKEGGFSDRQADLKLSELEQRAAGWAKQDGGVAW